jgi:hypothetical protein
MTAAMLTVRERSCLLRAAHEHLDQLHEQYESALNKGMDARAHLVRNEIGCLTAATAWLWRQAASDDVAWLPPR